MSFGVDVLGYGGNLAVGKDLAQPLHISLAILEGYFQLLLDFVTSNEIGGRRYAGMIVHVNNFDVVMDNKETKFGAVRFFNEIRDLLQTPKVYFIFLGPKNFYQDIIATQKRVKSIFYQTPLQMKPLKKTEIVEAFDRRMRILQSDNIGSYTKPVYLKSRGHRGLQRQVL